MTTPVRTTVKKALFDRLAALTFPAAVNGFTGWQLTSQRLKLWNAVDPTKQPAMFLVQHREEHLRKGTGLPDEIFLNLGVWCYAPTGTESVIGDQYLDSLEQAIETVFVPDNFSTNNFTLGGLCVWARIDRQNGVMIRDPGDIDGQALLVVPVRILLL